MKNVCIFMQSRTGSSLVAAAFTAHGWANGGERVRSRNYTTYENPVIRNHLVQTYGSDRKSLVACDRSDETLREIVEEQFGGHAWAWKGDVYYANIWHATFEDLAYVYVKRNIDEAIASSLDPRSFPILRGTKRVSRKEAEDELRTFLRTKYDLMVDLEEKWGGRVVFTSDVMRGRYHTLAAAINACGGTWNQDIAKTVIRLKE